MWHIILYKYGLKKISAFVVILFILVLIFINIHGQIDVNNKSKNVKRIDKTDEVKKLFLREKIIKISMSYLGIEYWPGGQDTHYGMDCSGFTQLVYKSVGINIPRSAYAQYLKSVKVSKSFLEKGDLVFFSTKWLGINHVGIYIGHNKFIHSPSIGKCIKIDLLNSRYWEPRFISGGKYIN